MKAQAPLPRSSGSQISLNFDDADVYQVVQTVFGEALRANYIVDSRVKGRVTFRSVAPVPYDKILPIMEVILRINGIGFVEEGGLYRIVPISEVPREPSDVRTGRDPAQIIVTGKAIVQLVPILYLQSSEVLKLITPFLSATAVAIDVPTSNNIVVVDTDASVRRILILINTFDSPLQKKKQPQVFVLPVQNGKATDISNLLNQIFLGAKPTTTSTTTSKSTSGTTKTSTTSMPPAPTPPMATPQILAPGGKGTGGETLVSDVTKIFADEIRNSLIILATPEDYETIKAAIDKIDTTPRQVLIEGIVAEVTLSDDFKLGLAYAARTHIKVGHTVIDGITGFNGSSFADSSDSSSTTGTGSTTTASTSSSGFLLPAATDGFSWIGKGNDGDFAFFINALADKNRSKTLAAPHILVSDNREAHIQVGQQVPIVTSSTINPGGTSNTIATNTIQYKDIGIILKIKPQVNESGLVALEISQEISTFKLIEISKGQNDIIINKTEAATNLVVHDGQTIVIGGLIREDKSNDNAGIPFLSRIPLLGYLFGTTTKNTTRNELIILLTPRVIKSARDAKDVTADYVSSFTGRSLAKGGMQKEDLLRGGVQSNKTPSKDVLPGAQVTPKVEPSPAPEQQVDELNPPAAEEPDDDAGDAVE
jgi:type II secretory pathway component GspD/PulD (secretin)